MQARPYCARYEPPARPASLSSRGTGSREAITSDRTDVGRFVSLQQRARDERLRTVLVPVRASGNWGCPLDGLDLADLATCLSHKVEMALEGAG